MKQSFMSQKRWMSISVLLIVVLFMIGCVSTKPLVYTDNPKKDFTILGEVSIDSSVFGSIQRNGFNDLLAAAKQKYSNCDYVIDVMIDQKTTVFLFFVFTNYKLRGTAIEYKK